MSEHGHGGVQSILGCRTRVKLAPQLWMDAAAPQGFQSLQGGAVAASPDGCQRGDPAAPAGCPHLGQMWGVGGPGTALQLQRDSV